MKEESWRPAAQLAAESAGVIWRGGWRHAAGVAWRGAQQAAKMFNIMKLSASAGMQPKTR
jgi:hypothetical protein